MGKKYRRLLITILVFLAVIIVAAAVRYLFFDTTPFSDEGQGEMQNGEVIASELVERAQPYL